MSGPFYFKEHFQKASIALVVSIDFGYLDPIKTNFCRQFNKCVSLMISNSSKIFHYE